jgi:cytochrome oxidase assembly protein ShyY1
MRLSLIPTIIVAAAVATMISLGLWQLRRSEEKQAAIVRFHQAADLPPVSWPGAAAGTDRLLYRRAKGICTEVLGWRAVAGRNPKGDTGWSHIAACPGIHVDMGWSPQSASPATWKGGPIEGIVAPDRDQGIRLVAAQPAPGFQPSARPDPEATPNNHLLYAAQWFFFALAAAIIYLLALRRRRTGERSG